MEILFILITFLISIFSYDRNGGVDYALKYAEIPNHKCGNYIECTPCSYWGNEACGYSSSNADGANFVSQCIVLGGGHQRLNGGKPCRGYPCGFEEIGGINLGECLQKKGWNSTCGYQKHPPSYIKVGDVLIYHSDSCESSTVFSSIITTAGDYPKITSNSNIHINTEYDFLANSKPYYQWLHFIDNETDILSQSVELSILSTDNNEFIFNGSDSLIFEFNKKNIDIGNDIVIKKENVLTTYTNTENQKRKLNDKNETSIDLSKCEDKLKIFYNISDNSSLYIIIEGRKMPIIEYELYYPLYNETFIKLNLDECKGVKAEISYPVKIYDIIDKYNASSDYYNSFCYKTTSDYGTDISLNDRKKEFIDNNMTLCEEDCNLIDYNYETEKAKCSCYVKINIRNFEEIKFDKDKLLKSFIDIKNIANVNLIKCYKEVFIGKNLIKNYGFLIFIFLFVIFFIILILFYTKFYFILINRIKEIQKVKIIQ